MTLYSFIFQVFPCFLRSPPGSRLHLVYHPPAPGSWLINKHRPRRSHSRPRWRRRRRLRRRDLPGRLPQCRPHRRRRHARDPGATTATRCTPDGHLRLVSLGNGTGSPLRLLDPGRTQGTQPGQGGRAGPVQCTAVVRHGGPVQCRAHGHRVHQEGCRGELGARTHGHDQDVAGRRGDVFGVEGYADFVSLIPCHCLGCKLTRKQSRYVSGRRGSRCSELGVHQRVGTLASPELPAAVKLDP